MGAIAISQHHVGNRHSKDGARHGPNQPGCPRQRGIWPTTLGRGWGTQVLAEEGEDAAPGVVGGGLVIAETCYAK
jgi:hypothetical protein